MGDMMACNAVIHTLDEVMFPVSLSQLEEADSSDDSSGDMSNVTASKAMLTGLIPSIPNPLNAIPSIPNPLNAVSGAIAKVPSLGDAYGTATGAVNNLLSF